MLCEPPYLCLISHEDFPRTVNLTNVCSRGISFRFCDHEQSRKKQSLYGPQVAILESYEWVAEALGVEIEDFGLVRKFRSQIINNCGLGASDLWSSKRDSNCKHEVEMAKVNVIRA